MTEDQLCDLGNFYASKSKPENRCSRTKVEILLFKGTFKKFMIKD